MSIYRFRADNDNTLRIRTYADSIRVWASIGTPDGDIRGLHIPNADVPTVALELLKAAGRTDLAALIESAAREAAEKAEAEAAEKKLQERRDALTQKFSAHPYPYSAVSPTARNAIDAYIELQDKLAGASRD